MAHGVPTPAETVLKFRAAYIRLGTVAAASREAGIPGTTGWDLADRAEDDPEFVEARKRINARALEGIEDLVIAAAQTVEARIQTPDPTPAELANIAVEHDLKSFNYANPKPQYFKSLVDAHRSIAARVRMDAEKSGEIMSAALVIVTKEEPKKPDDGSSG
jgi:hypothetical protein